MPVANVLMMPLSSSPSSSSAHRRRLFHRHVCFLPSPTPATDVVKYCFCGPTGPTPPSLPSLRTSDPTPGSLLGCESLLAAARLGRCYVLVDFEVVQFVGGSVARVLCVANTHMLV